MRFIPAKTPKLLKLLFPRYIWSLPASKSEKVIYLTFDDGPVPDVTEFVLNQLKLYDVQATFFCIGDNIKKHPDIFKKIIQNNHSIGNHTYNHLKAWKVDFKTYLDNTKKCQEEIQRHAPKLRQCKLFRPPYGHLSYSKFTALKKMGYKIILWDVLAKDWIQDHPDENYYYKNVVNNATNGSIIVFHDSLKAEKNLKKTLPKILEYFSKRGYEFRRITF